MSFFRRARSGTRIVAITFALAIPAACASMKMFHVPSSAAGDVPMKLVNDTAWPLCELRLSPAGSKGDNFVGGFGVPPQSATEPVLIKGGSYTIEVRSCKDEVHGTSAAMITGPTEIHVAVRGPSHASTPGYVAATVTVKASAGAEKASDAPQNPGCQESADMCGGETFGPCCPGLRCVRARDESVTRCQQ
jgi:hypothetical protein